MNQMDPWNDSEPNSDSKTTENGFENNFIVEQKTILELPESDKYLESLERKLSKIQPKSAVDPQLSKRGQKMLAKDLINSLKAKRDEIFREELGPDVEFSCADQTKMQAIQTKIMQTEIFKEVTRKVAPHLLAIDGDELKSLTIFDFLNDITQESTQE